MRVLKDVQAYLDFHFSCADEDTWPPSKSDKKISHCVNLKKKEQKSKKCIEELISIDLF